MRKLVKVLIILVVLWTGWWWLASTGMQMAVTAQFNELEAQGWRVEKAAPEITGFPFALRQNLGQIRLTGPDQTTLEATNLTLAAKAYWPGYTSVILPQTPIKITANGAPLYLQFNNATADMHLRPGTALELQKLAFTSGSWQINDATGNLVTAQNLTLSLLQDAQAAETYAFNVQATNLAPGDVIRAKLNVPANAPLTFDAYTAQGSTRLNRPLDRALISGAHARPDALALKMAEITWGDISVNATADLTFDTLGTPEGEVVTSVQNWRSLLNYARVAGVISQQQETQSGMMLGIFANMSGTPDDLSLMLRATDGQMTLNGIGIGPAPKVFQP